MTAPLRALLVDDEWPALQRLQQLLADHGGVEVVAQASSVNEAIAQLQHQAVDLVFLDLRMPGADGPALLPHLSSEVAVIFTTAHHDFAVSAFRGWCPRLSAQAIHPGPVGPQPGAPAAATSQRH